jgi:hypothetical protein
VKRLLMKESLSLSRSNEVIRVSRENKQRARRRLTGLFGSGGRFDLKKGHQSILLLESFEVFKAGERLDCFRLSFFDRPRPLWWCVRIYTRRDFQVHWRYNGRTRSFISKLYFWQRAVKAVVRTVAPKIILRGSVSLHSKQRRSKRRKRARSYELATSKSTN